MNGPILTVACITSRHQAVNVSCLRDKDEFWGKWEQGLGSYTVLEEHSKTRKC